MRGMKEKEKVKEKKVNEKGKQTKRTGAIKLLLRKVLWLKCYNKQKQVSPLAQAIEVYTFIAEMSQLSSQWTILRSGFVA